jgi:hypothetical protein
MRNVAKPNNTPWLVMLSALLFVLILGTMSGCGKEETPVETTKTLTPPTSDRDEEWRTFVRDVAKSKYVPGKTSGGQVFVRFLGTTEAIEGHLRDTTNQFSRPMQRGSVMVYGSYNSRNMAKLLVDAFSTPGIDGNLSGSTLVFVGRRSDEKAVREASVKSGVTLEFFPVD